MNFLERLGTLLKPSQIRTDSDSKEIFGRDWTRVYTPNPQAILFPESVEEVQNIVRMARETKTSLVPSGGRTGLSGGAVARNAEVVVALDRLNQIGEFNPVDRYVRCQAGVITENLQERIRQEGYYFPVDFASRGSSQIGGNISTNAGGTKVIRYGVFREWVLSLSVVTGAGDLLTLHRGLKKDNSGIDLKNLFIGSEGCLGIIVEAQLSFTNAPKSPKVILLACNELKHSLSILKTFQEHIRLSAFEFFTDKALDHVLSSHPSLQAPFDEHFAIYILIEFETEGSPMIEKALEAFDSCIEKRWAVSGAITQNDTQAHEFWKYRELISESISRFAPYKNDISVPISQIPIFVERVEKQVLGRFPKVEVVWFGHIGDGNLHINVLPTQGLSSIEFAKTCEALSQLLFAEVEKFGGSISAEHGIGILKKAFLHYSRSKEEIEIMRKIKNIFDPDTILNPGKVFD